MLRLSVALPCPPPPASCLLKTTDRKVNEVTPALFRRAPDAAGMAALGVPEITDCIRQLGLAPTKAKNLQALSQVGAGAGGSDVAGAGQSGM